MVNLIQNENMKIYRRMRTWILMALLVVFVILGALLFRVIDSKGDNDWKTQLASQTEGMKSALSSDMPAVAKTQLEKEIKINEYRLEHDLKPDTTLWMAVERMSGLIFIVTIFTVIVAGDIVAGEFSTGTIKLLLIRPASRTKILLSKYIASFLYSVVLLVVLFISSLIVNGILYGFGGLDSPYLYVNGSGAVVEGLYLPHVLSKYGLACVEMIMIVTMAFMISTVFRSSLLSIALSILLLFVGTSIVGLFSKYAWAKYILFANTDLSVYLNDSPMFEGMTLSFSITVLIVYFVIFNALSWFIFNKRDVAA